MIPALSASSRSHSNIVNSCKMHPFRSFSGIASSSAFTRFTSFGVLTRLMKGAIDIDSKFEDIISKFGKVYVHVCKECMVFIGNS